MTREAFFVHIIFPCNNLEKFTCHSELILQGAAERLAPILMTASSTALALLPLIVRGNLPGHEIEYPMAIVIVGGLLPQPDPFLSPQIRQVFKKPLPKNFRITILTYILPLPPDQL